MAAAPEIWVIDDDSDDAASQHGPLAEAQPENKIQEAANTGVEDTEPTKPAQNENANFAFGEGKPIVPKPFINSPGVGLRSHDE